MSSFNVYNTALLFSLHTVGTRGNNWRFILVINIGISLTSLHKKVFFFFVVASSLFSVYSSLKFWYWRWHGNVAENMTWQESYANFSSFPFFTPWKFLQWDFLCALLCVRGAKSFSFLCYISQGSSGIYTYTHSQKTGEKNIYKWKIVSSTTTTK